MVSYDELRNEPEWNAEFEAPAHAAFNERLRDFYNLTKIECGSKGDNNHLAGRHRSRNWILGSTFCTNRAYATTDARDKRGDGDWLRATDVGIEGERLWEASKRLDAAVRAGYLPCIAEWFGTFDGESVVGWFQGKPSSSDDSHLWHLHIGLWTEFCDNEEQLRLLSEILTGGDDMTPEQSAHFHFLIYRVKGIQDMKDPIIIPRSEALGIAGRSEPNLLAQAIRSLQTGGTGTGLSAEQVQEIVRNQLNATHLSSD